MRNTSRLPITPAVRRFAGALAVAAVAALSASSAGRATAQPSLALFSFAVAARRGKL